MIIFHNLECTVFYTKFRIQGTQIYADTDPQACLIGTFQIGKFFPRHGTLTARAPFNLKLNAYPDPASHQTDAILRLLVKRTYNPAYDLQNLPPATDLRI
jgi:hypothetical protein